LIGVNEHPRRRMMRVTETRHYATDALLSDGRWRTRPHGTPVRLSPLAHSAVRAVIERALAQASGPLWMPPGDLATMLGAAGITLAAAEQTTPAEALATAERLGYPLVAKTRQSGCPAQA